MFKIQTFNKIAVQGLDRFPLGMYEVASEIGHPDALLLRSQNLHQEELPSTLKAIARAGAGVNNIPIERCSERGIVVFNTPGANANSVKELVIAALFLSSRKIYEGIQWVKNLAEDAALFNHVVEKQKAQFSGPEIQGKTLGVIGLGAIGVQVANAAEALGMDVVGYDPFLTVDAAWDLSKNVKRSVGLESMVAECDYLTIHVPLNDETRGMMHRRKFAQMKPGIRLLNFSRGELFHDGDLLDALNSGKVSCYVTDFPTPDLVRHERVLPLPHLGASTPEASANCAVMAVDLLKDFLEHGNIKHSVNFPRCEMPPVRGNRLVIANRNVPRAINQITAVLAEENINIEDMLNRHKGDYAFNIIDYRGDISPNQIERLRQIDCILQVRQVPNS